MANIKKNFNFRNGVQVDDDNLLVTDTGLVGIGTTIPNEALDVRGNVIVTGFTSTPTAQIGILTVTTFVPNQITGAGLSVFSGIVTAQGSGILTYFGDARNLQGMPTSQWEDKDVGLGFTSIYNTGGNVGVGTEDPRSTFQVGNNADAGEKGVGISSVGNINATGIITAPSFIGDVTGDVTGRITGDLVGNINSAGLSTFTTLDVNGQTDLINVNVSGTSTVTGNIGVTGNVTVDGFAIIDQVNINDNAVQSNTANTNLKLRATGTGILDLDDSIIVSGISTFQGVIEAPAGMNKVPSLYMNMSNLPAAGDYHGMFAHVHSTGRGYFAHAMNWYELVNKDLFGVVGTGTERYNLGITTISNLIVSGTTNFNGAVNATTIEVPNATVTSKLGVGTTDTPAGDLQVTKSSLAEIQICSTGSVAQLNVGKEVGTSKTHTSQIRFGGGAGAPYSASGTALDIINYDTGNFNYHLSGNNAGAVVGDFHWHKGINSARLMTLTGIGGSLGIGNTQPTKELDVTGAGNFSGNLTVGNNLNVNGLILGNIQGQLTGNVSGTLAGNANATVGVSTLNNLTIAGVTTTTSLVANSRVAIGTDSVEHIFVVNDLEDSTLDDSPQVFITNSGSIGIRTTSELANVSINAHECGVVVGGLGVGSTVVVGAVDMREAGRPSNNATDRFMFPPQVTTAQRGNLSGVLAGAMIYNTSVNRLQVFNGSTWKDCFT